MIAAYTVRGGNALEKLGRDFYDRDTLTVARELLGKRLVRVLPGGARLSVSITETEGYIGRIDRACHAYNYKRTARTETLFARPGTAYIYLIYGLYCCLNFVTEGEGEPAAVLIRGGVCVENADIIAENRFGRKSGALTADQRKNFLNGPGKLCKGLSLTRAQNGLDLLGDELYVRDGPAPAPERVRTGRRIGVDYAGEAAAFPWRYWVEGQDVFV